MNVSRCDQSVRILVPLACLVMVGVGVRGDEPKRAGKIPTSIEKLPIVLSRLDGLQGVTNRRTQGIGRLSPDGAWFVLGDSIWNTATGKRVSTHKGFAERPGIVYFTRTSRPMFLWFRDKNHMGAAIGVDALTGKVKFHHPHFYPRGAPKFSSNHALICLPYRHGSSECRPLIIDSASGAKISRLDTSGIRLSPSGSSVHGFTDDGLRYFWRDHATSDMHLWSVGDGRRLISIGMTKHFDKHHPRIAVNRNGTIAVAYAATGRLGIFDLKTGPPVSWFDGPKGRDFYSPPFEIQFSPDGKRLAMYDFLGVRYTHRIRIVELAKGKVALETIRELTRTGDVAPDELGIFSNWRTPYFWHIVNSRPAMQRFLPPFQPQRTYASKYSQDRRLVLIMQPEYVPDPDRGKPFALPVRRPLKKLDVSLWETITGKQLVDFTTAKPFHAVFSDDSTRLALIFFPDGQSGMILGVTVLDLTFSARSKSIVPLSEAWTKLGADDPSVARRALFRLVAGKDKTVSLLAGKLKPATPPKNLDRLISDLDAGKPETWQAAEKSLRKLGAAAIAALKRAAQAKGMSADAGVRIRALLAAQTPMVTDAGQMRQIRGVEVLERIGGRNAATLLAEFAKGIPESLRTAEALRARQRVLDRGRTLSSSAAMRRELAKSLRLYWLANIPIIMPEIPLPLQSAPPGQLRTYRFTARITKNGGVTPFKVGTTISGEFTIDTTVKDSLPDNAEIGRYRSEKNSLIIRYENFTFKSDGPSSVGVYKSSTEGFSFVAHNLRMPKGWMIKPSPRQIQSRSFGVMLQNSPARRVINSIQIPNSLPLRRFVNTREIWLDFHDGVEFPGGSVAGRATVYGSLQALELK